MTARRVRLEAPTTITTTTTTTSLEDLPSQTPSRMKNTKRKAKEVSNTARPPRRSSTRKQVTLTPYPEASPSRPRSRPPRPAPRTCSTPPSSQPWVLKVSAHTRFLPQRFLLLIQIPARWTTSTTDHYQIQSGFLSMVAVWPVSMIIKSATCPIVPQTPKPNLATGPVSWLRTGRSVFPPHVFKFHFPFTKFGPCRSAVK